jgi:hypothetical protein
MIATITNVMKVRVCCIRVAVTFLNKAAVVFMRPGGGENYRSVCKYKQALKKQMFMN